MAVIEIDRVSKSFGQKKAVYEVSVDVTSGEIFGLLGPNGAGKTTLIRILLDIFKPDQGRVAILGGPMSEQKKDLIGYLPEERGLYQDVPLERALIYLATLKGLSHAEARTRVEEWLTQFDLISHRRQKVKELSKGMQQKAQRWIPSTPRWLKTCSGSSVHLETPSSCVRTRCTRLKNYATGSY